ncbi:MAG: PstS family phosphate ABC transporter substrate-binding protein, partial [Candidatus Sumerlaeia bacterium]|nr:PstS family phosphate ABC transporter substrate-binding protein [Candidatus Sumerlaeia bacterium]
MLSNQTKARLIPLFISFTILLLCFSTFAQKRFIQIKGSDTEVNLVQTLAETYMKSNPGISLAVTGGGSGTGIAALINKKTDIANSSRPIKADELELAKQQGVEPVSLIFATDALAVIVHSSNPLTTVTLEQLGQIYRGEIKNWRTLGGPDLPITLYGRQSNSGTFVFFREFVVKADYSSEMRQMNGNSQIVESLRNDKSGIGYVGIGYIL